MAPPKELKAVRETDDDHKQLEKSSKKLKQFDRSTVQIDDAHIRRKVCDALKNFKDAYRKFLQEKKGLKKGKVSHRIDILASNMLKKQGKWVNSDEEVGSIPGVEIGDQFQFRAEMVVIGLHKHHVNGITYIHLFGNFFATSIINSSRYYNNVRVSEGEFEYVGEGGNPIVSKKKAKDQILTKGNLALITNMREKYPVRVSHYWECGKSDEDGGRNGKYIYDGLYHVSSYKKERNDNGKLVFKFKMTRLLNQKSSSVPLTPTT